jgi:sucrose-6-phosphate hydrolase SacC (GH32 family)
MRYAPPGLCLNDFECIRLGDLFHLIHLQGPPIYPFDATYLESSYGHAVSKDLISWESKPPVFGISSPPSFDDSAIWTMNIVQHENRLWMFYTGLSHEVYFRQQIGLAISDKIDGTGWTRFRSSPIVSADPAYYQTEGDMAWRDPYIVFDEERNCWLMYIAAKTKRGRKSTRGCIGMAVSTNLIDWEVREPIISPSQYGEMECPVMYRSGDDWYLFVSISDDRRIHTYHARNSVGPFNYLGALAPPNNYAPRIAVLSDGDPVLLHTVSRRWQHQDNGAPMRGMLAQPKRIIFDDSCLPQLLWFKPVESYLNDDDESRGKNGLLSLKLPTGYSNLNVRLRMKKDNRQVQGVELILDRDSVRLQYIEDKCTIASVSVQDIGPFRQLKILMFGEYYEVYCDDILQLSTMAYRHSFGTFEAWIDDKAVDFSFRPFDSERYSAARDDLNSLW